MIRYKQRFFPFFKRCLQLVRIAVCVPVAASAAETVETATTSEPVRILFFGDSLTAGYGLDPEQAYPALIQQKIESHELAAEVTVGAVSGDTSAGGLRRIDWMLRQRVDIFVLALGANDGLRGIDLVDTTINLQAIINKVQAKYPSVQIIVAGMQIPPNIGQAYAKAFAAIYPKLAEANKATLIPFLLEGVGGRIDLNLPDRIHPNAEGHALLAETVWRYLEPLLATVNNENL